MRMGSESNRKCVKASLSEGLFIVFSCRSQNAAVRANQRSVPSIYFSVTVLENLLKKKQNKKQESSMSSSSFRPAPPVWICPPVSPAARWWRSYRARLLWAAWWWHSWPLRFGVVGRTPLWWTGQRRPPARRGYCWFPCQPARQGGSWHSGVNRLLLEDCYRNCFFLRKKKI